MSIKYFDLSFQIYIYFLTFVLGAVMGSFLNCCAYRICHNMPISKGRSECDNCKHLLGPLDLIPLVSYLISGGKCRYCGKHISIRYPLTELISGLLYCLIVYKFEISLETIKYLVLISCLLCASFADIEDFLIPDRLIVIVLINRIIFILLSDDILSELLNSVIGALCITVPLIILVIVMSKVMKREAMGGGDIKLFFMIGSYFPVLENLLALLISCFIGLLFATITKQKDNEFPFGPSICVAYFITLMVGSYILSSYFSLFL